MALFDENDLTSGASISGHKKSQTPKQKVKKSLKSPKTVQQRENSSKSSPEEIKDQAPQKEKVKIRKIPANNDKEKNKGRFRELLKNFNLRASKPEEADKLSDTEQELLPSKEKTKINKQKKTTVKRMVAELIPIIDISDEGYFELKENEGFFEIVQIDGKDIFSRNESEKAFDIRMLAQFYQAYHHCIKFTFMNFPVETHKQQEYIKKKLRENQNPFYEPFLHRKLEELEFLETNRTNREYFLFIFAPNKDLLKDRVNSSIRLIETTLPVYRLSDEKKIEFLFKLNNQNSKISSKR
ncbi:MULTISPECIES: hypothetical protein [Bacillus]|uniref:hypothetical protein n=1 Tax=Bacillus amyloliquefaciens group TaxID=1938374 RepID=UPI0032DE9879